MITQAKIDELTAEIRQAFPDAELIDVRDTFIVFLTDAIPDVSFHALWKPGGRPWQWKAVLTPAYGDGPVEALRLLAAICATVAQEVSP